MTHDELAEWANTGERNGVTVEHLSGSVRINIGLCTLELNGEALDEFNSGTEELMAETRAELATCELAHAAIVLVCRELDRKMAAQ